jgi:hypothetical protein
MKNLIQLVRDYGLIDVIHSKNNIKKKGREISETSFKRIDKLENSQEGKVYFLPWRVSFGKARRMGLISKRDNCIAYEVPIGIANPNPYESKRIILDLVEDFSNLSLSQIDLIGYSIGVIPATFIANNFPIKSLTMVGIGTRLGECLWNGVATREIKRKTKALGIKNPEEYDEVLNGLNPIDNTKNLPENLDLHLPMNDRYIPTKYGKRFVSLLDNKRKRYNLKRYRGCGHILTLLKYGDSNRL